MKKSGLSMWKTVKQRAGIEKNLFSFFYFNAIIFLAEKNLQKGNKKYEQNKRCKSHADHFYDHLWYNRTICKKY